MNDELMRKISDALDSEDGIAGDPDVLKAMADDPEMAKYARHLGRLQRWVAAWPLAEPDDDDMEALAQKIDARLGEKFSSDFTIAPDFEEDEEYATVTSGLLRAGEGESEPSHSLELTMSQITELADQVNEESSSKSIARVPLKKKESLVEAALPKSDPRSGDDDLPAPVARPAKPRAVPVPVPAPSMASTKKTVMGHADPTPPALPSAPAAGVHKTMIGHADPGAASSSEVSDPESALPLLAKWKSAPPPAPTPATVVSETVAPRVEPPAASKAPPALPPVEAKAPPVAPSAEPKAPSKPTPRADAKPPATPGKSAKPAPVSDRVSIPMAAPSGPRLELLEGGAAQPARSQPRQESRGWLPGLLAAAAIGLGVIGVGTLMSSGGREPGQQMRSGSAPAAGAMAPAATAAPAPMTPSLDPMSPSVEPPPPMPERSEIAMAPTAEAPASPPAAATPAVAAVAPEASDDGFARGIAEPTEPAPSVAGAARARPMAVTSPMRGGAGGAARGAAPDAAERRSPTASRSAASTETIEGSAGAPRAAAGPGRAAGPAATSPAVTSEGTGGAGSSSGSPSSGSPGSGSPGSRSSSSTASGGGDATPLAARPAPAPPPATGPAVETLDRATVQAGMATIEPAVRACAGERHGTAQVDVVVQGTGRVTSATITGLFQGSPEGSCIARAVRQARFPQFTGEPLRFRYPFAI